MKFAVITLLVTITAAPAMAENCATTFAARLADAKKAVVTRDAFIEEHQAEYRAASWFNDHCRFLSDLEIAIRKIDDPNSFVCDAKAKGRPRGLTAELVGNFSSTPLVSDFQADAFHGPNHACMDHDRAHGVALVGLDEMTPVQQLAFLCFADDSERCVKARLAIEAAKAKGHE